MGGKLARHATGATLRMILVDTSVWIDHYRGTDSAEALWLNSAIRNDVDLCVCGIVLTEVLQGIKSIRHYRRVKQVMEALVYLQMFQNSYILAADLYRDARAQGKIIRSTIDCLIAACAISNDVPLLQKDKDFLAISSVSTLSLVVPT